jgi:hypothetical protein
MKRGGQLEQGRSAHVRAITGYVVRSTICARACSAGHAWGRRDACRRTYDKEGKGNGVGNVPDTVSSL